MMFRKSILGLVIILSVIVAHSATDSTKDFGDSYTTLKKNSSPEPTYDGLFTFRF